jgi:hypothetical protein
LQVSISSAYRRIEWGEDLKQLSKQCGVQHQSTVFVIYEAQIIFPLQIEDPPNRVAHGDVSLLFSSEEIVIIKFEVQRSQLEVYDDYSALFIHRLSRNLQFVVVVSPSGTV